MIIDFKVANYRSINAEQTLSFVADRATRHPGNLIKRPGYRLLKAVGLFGANASGKSNLVRALGAMSSFVRDSATKMNDGDTITAAEPYRLDPTTRNAPSRFEISFVTDSTVYIYGFAVFSGFVYEEWLTAKTETSDKEIFSFKRTLNISLGTGGCFWSPLLEPYGELIFSRTRINGLLLTTAARENVKELLPVYRYIRDHIRVHNMAHPNPMLVSQTAEWCQDDEQLSQKIGALLRDADTGIDALSIQSKQSANPSDQATTLTQINDIDSNILFPEFQLTTLHKDASGKTISFDFIKTGSIGTQRLFALSGIFLNALEAGELVVMDELDASMHPLLTRKLLELFQSSEANPHGAQLLFTTHDPSLLDQELFRRDQIWLAEKCDGASTFFSLADIQPPVRNTESFLRNYLTGRYGGTPHLGPAFDSILTGTEA